jgi:hypothetical protein
MKSLSKILLSVLLLAAISGQAYAGSPSKALINKAKGLVSARATNTFPGATGGVGYAGTTNQGRYLRVVAYRHAPQGPLSFLVAKKAPNTVSTDPVYPPSASVLQKAAKDFLANR